MSAISWLDRLSGAIVRYLTTDMPQRGTIEFAGDVVVTDDETNDKTVVTIGSAGPFQPLDSDLTAIAALTTTAFGRSLLTQTDANTARTTLGVGTVSASADLDGSITPTSSLYTVPITDDGVFWIEATVMCSDLYAGAPVNAHGGVMRTVASWRRVGDTPALLRCETAASKVGGAMYLLNPASDEADMDLDVYVSGSDVIVRVTPSVLGTFRYQMTARIGGPVT